MDRTVTVTGQGKATAVPDTAVIRVAAVHRAASVAEAFAGVASAVDAIGTEARQFTEERRIASQGLQVWPAHDNQGRQSGFETRHTIEIGCPDLTAASALLEALVAAVGDRLQVEGVTLRVSEPGPLVTTAREAAYADAAERASHLAGLAGATLGPIVSVSEGGAGWSPYPQAMDVAAMKAEAAFEPGEAAITATVTASWQLQL
jgi:uncharacterized protein YggE